MGSFAILRGPTDHFLGMIQRDRLCFTCVYVGSMLMTLYFTFSFGGARGYFLVMAASACQLLALLWYLISFIPGGAAGLHYLFAVMGHFLKPLLVVLARAQAICCAKCAMFLFRSSGSTA
jgi:hypothetical protein